MYQTQLLKIRIRPGKTKQVVEFLRGLMDRKEESLDALRREGMMVESMFLEQPRRSRLPLLLREGQGPGPLPPR